MLLAGEAATGKTTFVEVLVEPQHPYINSPIHPAVGTTHLRLLLSREVQGQSQASPWTGRHPDSKGFLLFLLEDLHLAASGEESGGKESSSFLLTVKSLAVLIDSQTYTYRPDLSVPFLMSSLNIFSLHLLSEYPCPLHPLQY